MIIALSTEADVLQKDGISGIKNMTLVFSTFKE